MTIAPSTPLAPRAAAAIAAPRTANRSFASILEASVPGRTRAVAHRPLPEPAPGLGARAVGALRAVEAARARLDGLLSAARDGRTFTPQELLGLQAETYRYAQSVDLAARLAEKGAQAVNQALHAQV